MEVARRWILAFALCAAAACAQSTDADLREGISLTSQGRFDEAIAHFVAARARGVQSFALEFNLALCYVGVRQFPEAIGILTRVAPGSRAAEVKELLAQAYVGDHKPEDAWKTFQAAATLAPDRERLYLLVSQACLDENMPDLAGRVLETGLRHLPGSAKLHFERGIFYQQQDDSAQANREFQEAQRRSAGSEIAYIAAAEQALIEGRMQDVIATARAGMRAGYTHYLLLTMLGEALLRSGATPATPEFAEARTVLEQAVAARPGYASSHITLGRVYLALGRNADAIAQLEAARRLAPRDKAVYPPLASAYQRSSKPDQAKEALAALAALNREDAARIGAAGGGHAGYTGK